MENNYNTTNATVSTNSFDSNFPAVEIMDLARKSCQVYRNTRDWRMCEEDLEDLIQDTVYKAVKYWNSFDPSKSLLGTWVSRIARNCWNDAYRKEMRRLDTFEPLVSENKEGDE
jgi:RNA polymerase sigma factor (sigma-70 family)